MKILKMVLMIKSLVPEFNEFKPAASDIPQNRFQLSAGKSWKI